MECPLTISQRQVLPEQFPASAQPSRHHSSPILTIVASDSTLQLLITKQSGIQNECNAAVDQQKKKRALSEVAY